MNLNIQMVDTKSQFLKIKEEIYKGFEEVFESSQFINGKQVKEFTEALKSFTRAKYIIPCANGTDAIQVALMALGLEPGDEVIVPTWTYVATAEVIALLKLKPIFIDADYNTFNIDVNKIEEKITSKTKAIVPVHLYGQTCEMEKIMELAKKYNLFVVEDTAQAIGSEYTFSTVGETTVVTADKPVLAMQFVRGGSYSNGTITRTGDPAMVVITPVVQYLNDVAITTPATGFDVNTATLVVPVADVGTITFNGTAIPTGSFGPTITMGSDNYKVAYVNLPLGAHRITSTNGFGVFVYGYNSADSYAYAAAAGMVDLVQYPGGVAQVGYVAANQIGTPQQQQQQAPPPAQVVAPPAPAIFFNRSIQVGTTGTIRLSGVNLTGLTSLKIGDKTVEIVSSGDGFAEIKLPELAAGVYNFSTTGTRTEGAWIGTQQLVLTVVAAAANPNPGGLKSATFTITNFVGGSAVLTAAMKARIAAEVAKHGGVKSSACVGATSGPTILSVDASLAQRRAVAVCNYIATLTPRVITTTSGKNTLLPGGSARKVTVTLRF
jgi:hypothetical protein